MTEMLQEFCDSRGVRVRVDREKGVIRGVKILGLQSRNGRTYLGEALSQAARLYEDAKVNVNHPKGSPAGPRDYRDRIGAIRNVAVRPDEGLFADFHFNPKHALAEQLAWDAEHAPEHVGFSHNVQARTSRRGGRLVVEAITHVQSVDLVADPATTAGLFESGDDDAQPAEVDAEAKAALDALSVDDVKQHRPDLIEALCQELSAEVNKLQGKVEKMEAQEAARRRQAVIRRLLYEFHLPVPEGDDPPAGSIVSGHFLRTLAACESEEEIRALVEERSDLVRGLGSASPRRESSGGRPRSRNQQLFGDNQQLDTKGFVEAIT